MIRKVSNDSVTSRIDMQIGRSGSTRRVDAIHVHRQGTEDRGEVVIDVLSEGKPVRIVLQESAARQFADWIRDQAV